MKDVWETQYKKEAPPWNYDGFDKDFEDFFRSNFDKDFSVIDLGCGNGSQAYHIEKLGFEVTATDIINVLEYDVKNFIIDDALNSNLDKQYDIVVDRGLIHNLFHLKKTRHKYFEMIGKITHDESYILLKVLSPYETRFNPSTHSGPHRFNENQLLKFFSMFNFKCVKLIDTYFYSNIKPHLRGNFIIYNKEENK